MRFALLLFLGAPFGIPQATIAADAGPTLAEAVRIHWR